MEGMIKRIWRGWVPDANAGAYARFLQDIFLPAAHDIPGYRGCNVLRRRVGEEWEFLTITHFDSLEAVAAFAGEDLEKAHVAPEARALLSRFDDRVVHYETAFDDLADPAGGPGR